MWACADAFFRSSCHFGGAAGGLDAHQAFGGLLSPTACRDTQLEEVDQRTVHVSKGGATHLPPVTTGSRLGVRLGPLNVGKCFACFFASPKSGLQTSLASPPRALRAAASGVSEARAISRALNCWWLFCEARRQKARAPGLRGVGEGEGEGVGGVSSRSFGCGMMV